MGLISSALSIAMCYFCYQRMLGQNASPGTQGYRDQELGISSMCHMCVQLPLLWQCCFSPVKSPACGEGAVSLLS